VEITYFNVKEPDNVPAVSKDSHTSTNVCWLSELCLCSAAVDKEMGQFLCERAEVVLRPK
jgi:hypothetical protein